MIRFVLFILFFGYSTALIAQSNTDSLQAIIQNKNESQSQRLSALLALSEYYGNVSADSLLLTAELLYDWSEEWRDTTYLIKSLTQLGFYHRRVGDTDASIQAEEEAYALSIASGNQVGEASALSNIGISYLNSDLQKASTYLKQAIQLCERYLEQEGLPLDTRQRLLSTLGFSLSRHGIIHGTKGEMKLAQSYFERAIAVYGEAEDPKLKAGTINNLGTVFSYLGDHQKALSYYQKAFAISDSLGDQSAIGISLASMASSYAVLGDIERAIQTNIRQIEIHRRIGKLHGVAVGLQNIALLYGKQGKSERKYEYTQRALAAYQSINNQDGIITASLVLGDYFLEQNRQLDSTLWYAKKAFQLSEEIDNNHNKALSLVQMARVQLQQKKPQTAVHTLLTALPFSEASGIHNSKIQTSLYLCQAYSDLQDYNKAITYGERALQTAEAHDDIHLINDAHQFLYPSYEAVGSFEQAMRSYKSYIAIRDSVQSEENQQAMAEAVYEYETQLDEAKIAEQEALLEQQQLRQRLSWIGLGALGVIATLLLVFGIAIRKRNRTLNKRNEEKAFLIKEIHHRVKNNLQILSSLLYLQSRTIEDDAALSAIKEGQNRVDSMGLIHQKLYMGEHLATVDIKDYLQNLGNNLLDAFGIYDDRIEFDYQIADLRLDIDTAIPLGLIVNELLTNTLKYAFPEQQSGKITIGLYEEDKTLQLTVQDDGVGATASNDTPKSNSTSFGSKLIRMFSEKLEGEVEIFKPERGYGTRIQIHQYQLVK